MIVRVEGAYQKANGKWGNHDIFPGREFDNLDAYRAAKKQREERRAAYCDQIYPYEKPKGSLARKNRTCSLGQVRQEEP